MGDSPRIYDTTYGAVAMLLVVVFVSVWILRVSVDVRVRLLDLALWVIVPTLAVLFVMSFVAKRK